MAKNDNLTDFLTDVANAIRTKKGTTALINPQDFSSEIASIQSGGGSDMLQERVDQTNSCAYLFYNYSGTDLSFANKLDTSKVTNMSSMFSNCKNLTSLDLSWIDTSNVTDMSNMFNSCAVTSLNLLHFNTSKVTSLYSIFNGTKMTSLDLSGWDVSKVTNMNNLIDSNYNLTSLNLSGWDTSNCPQMSQLFYYSTKLKSIIGVIDLYSAKSISSIFFSCRALEDVTLKNIKINLDLGTSSKLTNSSLLNTAQELWDNTNNALGGTRTLKMATASKTAIQSIYVKLVDITDEMRANDQYIDNKKPCVECASTDEGAMTLEEYIISKNWQIG